MINAPLGRTIESLLLAASLIYAAPGLFLTTPASPRRGKRWTKEDH